MKNNEEKKLSSKIADNALKILDSHIISLISLLGHVELLDWSFTVLAVAFILIFVIRVFYSSDPQRKSAMDSILKRMVRALVFNI